MPFARLPQLVAALLVLATVHQLGASPCGCLEHSGWRSMFVAPASHTATESDQPQLEAEHCDHSGWPPALMSVRWSDSDTARLETTDAVAFVPPADSPVAARCRAATKSRGTVAAPEMRAELQVFRL